MPIDDITDPQAVRLALAEYDALGQSGFLEKYGFGAARGWTIEADGRSYDAKAVLGAAHAYEHPALGPLPHTSFQGAQPTAKRLRGLGFTVREAPVRRNPVWSRDELIHALDLYLRHQAAIPDDRHPEVIALSRLLNRLATIAQTVPTGTFRNPMASR